MTGRYALLVSTNQYSDQGLSKLVAPDGDATALAEILRNNEIGGFDKVDILPDAPSHKVRREIARFFADRKRDDLLLLYFTGHGVRDDQGQLYLAQTDTERAFLSATAIAAAFVTSEMDRSRSGRIALVLDCCHSGAFAFGAKAAGAETVGADVGTGPIFQGTGFGRVVLTASDKTQYAWEGEHIEGEAARSIFTRHIIEGLASGEADRDHDGIITVDELYDYVFERVLDESEKKQTPHKWSYQQSGEILIARNPHLKDPMQVLPEAIVEALKSDFPGIRAGGVLELEKLLRRDEAALVNAARRTLERIVAEEDSRQVHNEAARVLGEHGGPAARAEAPPEPRKAGRARPRPAAEPPPVSPPPKAEAAVRQEPSKPSLAAKTDGLRKSFMANIGALAGAVVYVTVFAINGDSFEMSGDLLGYSVLFMAFPAWLLLRAWRAIRASDRTRFGPFNRFVMLAAALIMISIPALGFLVALAEF